MRDRSFQRFAGRGKLFRWGSAVGVEHHAQRAGRTPTPPEMGGKAAPPT